jgi:hypothetical protein
MTDEQLIEKLRTEVLSKIEALDNDQELIASLRAGQLRLIVTRDGVSQERLVPHFDLIVRVPY